MKDIIWPERRTFLARAPLVFASGLTLVAMPKVAKALAGFGGAAFMGGDPSQPSLASSNGFNTNVFYDNFRDIKSIDINNTNQPGYKWYAVRGSDSCAATTFKVNPGDVTLRNPGMSLNVQGPTGTCGGSQGGSLGTAGYNPTTGATPGVLIAPTGGYFESQLYLNTTTQPGGAQPQAFWLEGAHMAAVYQNGGMPDGKHYLEVDIAEVFTQGVNMQLHEWLNETVVNSTGGFPSIPGLNLLAAGKYGLLWKTIAQNGGTNGKFEFYYNGSLITSQTYTAGGTYASCETQGGFNMFLQGGKNWVFNVDYVTVWQ